jgi:hypothetical protein
VTIPVPARAARLAQVQREGMIIRDILEPTRTGEGQTANAAGKVAPAAEWPALMTATIPEPERAVVKAALLLALPAVAKADLEVRADAED